MTAGEVGGHAHGLGRDLAGEAGPAAGGFPSSRRSTRSGERGVQGGRRHGGKWRGVQGGSPPGIQRLILVALLLAGVLVGLRGGFTPPHLRGPLHRDGIAVSLSLEAVLAVLLVTLLARQRRAPTDDFVTRRLRVVLRAVLLAELVAVPIVLLGYRPLRGPRPAQSHPARPLPVAPSLRSARPARSAPVHLPLAAVLYTLAGLILLAAIVACVLLLRRHPPGRDALPEEASLADGAGQRTELRAAVRSGQRALAGLDDARAAIIACYLAMERSLAAAGADRTDADTPAEFLDRAAAAGLVHTAAAGQLTGLFYEARFSRHQLTGAERTAAEHALRQLDADLAEHP
jgi:Domain of unknown function (DUF4129)